jgi:hypothetical protein
MAIVELTEAFGLRVADLGYVVPEADFVLMREIRKAMASGNSFEVLPVTVEMLGEQLKNQADYHNAKLLVAYYGISPDEVLQMTGFHIDPEKVAQGKQ